MKVIAAKEGLDEALDLLARGGAVAYPTETFYGLGVDAHNVSALKRLREIKGRPSEKAFPVLLPERSLLSAYAQETGPAVGRLAERYWPGPLTIVLRARGLPEELLAPDGTLGFRISRHPVARELVRRFGRLVTTTSANAAGKPPARSARAVARDFPTGDLFVLDGGTTTGGKPSTVVNLAGRTPALVRPGAIPWEEILAALEGAL